MREGLSDELDGISRPSGPEGENEEWTLLGIAFDGMFRAFFEPDDPADPFAAPDLI